MSTTFEPPPAIPKTHVKLDSAPGLVMRCVSDQGDVNRVAALNLLVHEEPGIDDLVKLLIEKHPYGRYEHWLLVEDTENKEDGHPKVVASLCLLPWKLAHSNSSKHAYWSAELGFVGTHPKYRRRSLSRILTERYFALVASQPAYVMSHIQGIPGFYHRYGFTFCWPLEIKHIVSFDVLARGTHSTDGASEAPAAGVQAVQVRFSKATKTDAAIASQLYSKTVNRQGGNITVIPQEAWEFILEHSTENEYYLVYDNDQNNPEPLALVGVALPGHAFGNSLVCVHASDMSIQVSEGVLQKLGEMATERQCPSVRLNIARNSCISQLAVAIGSSPGRNYKWQIKLYFDKYFTSAKHLIESKLSSSPLFEEFTSKVVINMYQSAIALEFEKGLLVSVAKFEKPNPHAESGDFRLLPEAATRLILGDISIDELRTSYPDCSFSPQCLLLAQLLFAPCPAFLTSCYY